MLDKLKLKIKIKLSSLFTRKVKLGLVLMVLVLAGVGFYKVNQFFETHQFVFESPVSFQTPVYLIDRALAQNILVNKNGDNSPLNGNQQYLCNKFGKDCVTMLAIIKAESGFNCNAYHVNTNGTVDFGYAQINSIHLKKGYSLVDLADCHKNIDVAYSLFKAQGFAPWVAYTTGAYKKFLY